MTDQPQDDELDPIEFAKAMLGISKEDAAKVREQTPATRKRAEPEQADDGEQS